MTIEVSLEQLRGTSVSAQPELFNLSEAAQSARFESLLESGAIRRITDDYEEEQRELYAIRHPDRVYAGNFEAEFQEYFANLQKKAPLYQQGIWVYFPWSSTAAHILPEEEYRIVRTARNRNLVTEEEQRRFYNAVIGIGGLSVGSSVAFALALSGGGKHLKLGDMDRLALSNTNRVLAGANELGSLKVEMAARRIYEINPYAQLELFPEGISDENIDAFFEGLDVIVDELDTIPIKLRIREEAKKRNIPVVMGADNGDNAIIDIDRYDLNPDLTPFHDRLGNVTVEELKGLDKFGIGRTITKMLGPENITERMQQSLLEMGKTLVSWPQLGIAAMINGLAVAYCIRKIVNGLPLENDRALIHLDEKLDPEYLKPEAVETRKRNSEAFAKGFGL